MTAMNYYRSNNAVAGLCELLVADAFHLYARSYNDERDTSKYEHRLKRLSTYMQRDQKKAMFDQTMIDLIKVLSSQDLYVLVQFSQGKIASIAGLCSSDLDAILQPDNKVEKIARLLNIEPMPEFALADTLKTKQRPFNWPTFFDQVTPSDSLAN